MMRPEINEADDDADWQGTLLDRGPQSRRRPVMSREPEPKGRLWIAAAALGVVALVIIVTMMVKGGGSDSAPLIKADVTPYKTRPDQPGGTAVPFQDKLVFNRLDPNGQPVQAEKLLPPPEEPIAKDATPRDMTTKQVTAPPAPGNTPTASTGPAPLIVKPATPPEPIAEKPAVVAQAPVPQAAPVATVEKVAPTPTPVAPTPVAKTETPKMEEPKPAPVAKPAPAVAAAPAPVSGGQVRIQLASIPEAGNAQKALADLSGKYRGALGGTSLGIVKADLGAKGTYYRIQSGGVDRATAEKVCASIKAQGGACIIAH